MFKRLLLIIIFMLSIFFVNFSYAEDDWTLIPKASGDKTIELNDSSKSVWKQYRDKAEQEIKDDVGLAFKTGIFSWSILFDYLKYIAKLLSQIGLVIGAGMIIYAGYKYATGVFTGDASKGGKDAIKGAIYGLLIVIFSYAIMKILLAMFW